MEIFTLRVEPPERVTLATARTDAERAAVVAEIVPRRSRAASS